MGEPSFVDVGSADQLREGAALSAVVAGRAVAVFLTGGSYYALSDRCPHNGMPLHDGCVAAGVVTCRWHGWQFDLKTGRAPGDAEGHGPRVRVYPVQVKAGRLLIGLSGTAPEGEALV